LFDIFCLLGAGYKPLKRCTKSLLTYFKKAGVAPKKKIVEFPVSPDAILPVGYKMNARHFTPGQIIDVTGIT
jgi:large subunit ribosomal protein L3